MPDQDDTLDEAGRDAPRDVAAQDAPGDSRTDDAAPDEPTSDDAAPNEPATGEPAPGDPAPAAGERRFTPAAPSGAKRLWRAVTQRPDLGHVGVGLLVALLGFGAVVQVRADDDDTLANARRDDLVQILDGLRRQADRLDDHVTELEVDRRDLVSGANTEQEALAQAQERAEAIGVLAGTVPATGSGVIMTITDPDERVNAVLIQQAINELRVAGAEAIQIIGDGNESAVRVVAGTSFENPATDVLRVGGVEMEQPYQIVAIGDPRELTGAMTFAEGIVSKIEDEEAEATVTEYNELTVDVLHEPQPPQYARPAPEDEDDE